MHISTSLPQIMNDSLNPPIFCIVFLDMAIHAPVTAKTLRLNTGETKGEP